jgi:uncharacterized protein
MHSRDVPRVGVGLQYSPSLVGWFPFSEQDVDALEVLLDHIKGAPDSPFLLHPDASEELRALRRKALLLAHSNYGCEFGFAALEETMAARYHVPLARMIESPWVSDHCFYGEDSQADVFNSPLQWSRAELRRVVPRMRALQEMYGIPLLHENPAYYFSFPGSEMSDAEFLARLVEEADTYLHLDLHNVYTNSMNLSGYRWQDYLSIIPLERVVAIHVAGGRRVEGFYHDTHDQKVPEVVWEMLEQVLSATQVGAVIVEYEDQVKSDEAGRAIMHEAIVSDIERARSIWDRVYGPGSRRSTRQDRSA